MKAKKAKWEPLSGAREAGRIFDKTPCGIGEFLRRTDRKVLRELGIRRERTRRRGLVVHIADVWLVDGRAVPWVGEKAAAARLDMTASALREALEKDSRGGWVATYNGVPARRLVGCWLLCFEQKRAETASYQAGRAR
jgi:hypothetical protein